MTLADRHLEGVVLRGPGGPWRVRGRSADGILLASPCDRFGVDIRGADLVPAPLDHPVLVAVLRRLGARG